MLTKLLDLRFGKFCIVGAFSTLTHTLVFVLLIELAGVEPVVASIPSFSLAVIVSYAGNCGWTFQSDGLHILQLPKFMIVSVIGLIANIFITYTIVDILDGWYGLALAAVILIVPVMTYQLNRCWVFSTNGRTQI